jgi:glutathione S-transferase
MPVHWMLIELGVRFELELVDFASKAQKSPQHLARNPSGQVPTLEIDGSPHSEATALLMLLAERHPESGFARGPDHPDRPAYLELMVYLANNALPAIRAYFYPHDFASPANEEDVRVHAERRLRSCFVRLDDCLADGRAFLLGSRISAADFLFAIICRWSRSMSKPADNWPNIASYLARMKQRKGLRAVHEREGLTDWIG